MKIDFDFDSYQQFCLDNKVKPGHFDVLAKFERLCQSLGINTKPLRVKNDSVILHS